MKQWKQWTILSILALAFTLVCAEKSFSQYAGPKVKPSEAQLIERFTQILDEQLEKENICLSFRAGIAIERVIRYSAATVISEDAFDRLPEAERNFQVLAQGLIKSARDSSTGGNQMTRITFDDVRRKLTRSDLKSRWSLCPLFPICR